MTTENTSPSAPATGASGSSATETPAATTGATPQDSKASTALEEALARIAELERHGKNKEEEASRHGKNLSAAEKRLAEYEAKERQAQEAALSEVEKANKRAQEAEQLIAGYKQELVTAKVQIAAQSKGIIDTELAAMAISKNLEFDKDGMPSNVDQALDDLVKNKPFLVPAKASSTEPPAETAPASPAQTAQTPQAPQLPAMNPGPGGRKDIPSPAGQMPQGQVVRFGQIDWKK